MRGLVVCLALVSCARTTSERRTPPTTGGADASVGLSSIADKPLDSLSPPEARALCKEDAHRLDPCVERGVSETNEADCQTAVARCRAEMDGGISATGCSGFDLGPSGSCSITVTDYLACVDAWNAMQTCSNAGKYIATPSECLGIVEHCPRLAPVFVRDGTPPPCEADAGTPPHPGDDIYGFDGCRPSPGRFVVLGDSIAACQAVGPADCGPLLIGNYVKETVSPGLVIESHAASGARIADLPDQARLVAAGPEPVVVWIHILGNDLVLREVSDAGVAAAWDETFAYFGDASRFPGGVTFLLNTQYSPYDQCPEPVGGGFSISVEEDQVLQNVNRRVFISLGEQRSDTVTIDEYPDWLGHGDNANVLGCPHCGRDNTSWMSPDRIHPNALGYAHMVAKWRIAIDRMYGAACRGD